MRYNLETQFSTITDVKDFAEYISSERKVAFHPDDNFFDYVYLKGTNKGKPCFTEEESGLFNRLMDNCFTICEKANVDVYEVMNVLTT